MSAQVRDRKRLVVFDVAGTTVIDDDLVSDAFVAAFRRVGEAVPTRTAVDGLMGRSKRTAIASLLGVQEWDERVDRVHSAFLDEVTRAYRTKGVREVPGTSGVFRRLKEAGHSVALDTGFPRGVLDEILRSTGWMDVGLVDSVRASNEVSSGRPAPYMIFSLMEELGFARVADVVKVGDTLVDVEEGLSAGCGLVVGVTSGTCSLQDFVGCPWALSSDFSIVPDVTHVPGLLGLRG